MHLYRSYGSFWSKSSQDWRNNSSENIQNGKNTKCSIVQISHVCICRPHQINNHRSYSSNKHQRGRYDGFLIGTTIP